MKQTKIITDNQLIQTLKGISNGLTDKDACTLAGISENDLNRRARNDEVFANMLKRAEAFFKQVHIQRISEAGKFSWQASAWLLERKYPEFRLKGESDQKQPPPMSEERKNELLNEIKEAYRR